ncbi:aromatic-L-amino-acid decarboxylase-like isoform X3 [Tachypleus tridentatus]|uniref:aromatic-L-amino-acid decarboxylase-like isoform X3 n=1 Tax=Tachypleus tridentatus TaxID=6853 RepID=UPI003FD33F86
MDTEEFRLYGKQMVDFMADYMHNIRNHRVLPQISPGYVRDLVPEQAPEEGEPWEEVFKDIQRVVLPGSASPASTDLEMVMLDWLGKMVQLPQEFLFSSNGPGGGVVQSSASESTLMALLSAREKAISYVQSIKKDLSQGIILEKMVYYSSIEAHCSVEKAGLLSGLTCRLLPTDAAFSLQGDILQAAIDEDRTQGKIPFFVVGTLGTTNSCAFDNIEKLGEVCKKENLWFHIDAAYAGAAFICPEFRYLLNGVEYADSFLLCPAKWLLTNHDCCAMWVKDRENILKPFSIMHAYLKEDLEVETLNYRHWGIPCGRKFRSLKMWFVFRLFGVRGLQTYIRKHVRLAHEFENLARNDNRFEVLFPVVLGVVCFRLKGSEVQNEEMLRVINKRGKIALKSSRMRSHNLYFIRFVVCGKDTESEDIVFSWREISLAANNVLNPKVVGDKSETF